MNLSEKLKSSDYEIITGKDNIICVHWSLVELDLALIHPFTRESVFAFIEKYGKSLNSEETVKRRMIFDGYRLAIRTLTDIETWIDEKESAGIAVVHNKNMRRLKGKFTAAVPQATQKEYDNAIAQLEAWKNRPHFTVLVARTSDFYDSATRIVTNNEKSYFAIQEQLKTCNVIVYKEGGHET